MPNQLRFNSVLCNSLRKMDDRRAIFQGDDGIDPEERMRNKYPRMHESWESLPSSDCKRSRYSTTANVAHLFCFVNDGNREIFSCTTRRMIFGWKLLNRIEGTETIAPHPRIADHFSIHLQPGMGVDPRLSLDCPNLQVRSDAATAQHPTQGKGLHKTGHAQ